MRVTDTQKRQFLHTVYGYYEKHGRHSLPWRQPEPNGTFDPYKILVSEIMLQQTQVTRVIPKFQGFIKQFPSTGSLASAEQGRVLREWSGLGYNRRAKYLHQSAIALQSFGEFPKNVSELVKLPGVGKNTAGAILAYSYNKPAIFLETNIRTVYIHHFLGQQTGILDTAIIGLVKQTLDTDNPRLFYWALMDYGSHLKRAHGNLNKLSKTYIKQSQFRGSLRQLRGEVLRQLAVRPMSKLQLETHVHDSRLQQVLAALLREDLVSKDTGKYHL